MAVCRLPIIIDFTSPNVHLFSTLSPSTDLGRHRQCQFYHNMSCRGLTLSCSAKKPRMLRKLKHPKPNMSDADICNEIRRFMSTEGLPRNHVPSMAELSRRGRKDLAKIVRKRGYKAVAQLLRSQANADDIQTEENLVENQDSLDSKTEKSSGFVKSQDTATFLPEQTSLRDDESPGEKLPISKFDVDIISESENFDEKCEINHLKKLLLALSTLKNKANTDVTYIQGLIISKDAELRAAEEGLIGLKEVQIEYHVHGECVEVTGSFNGWHHRIQMDCECDCWMATLWLYPGVYEIKFVVDGVWKIDHRREVVSKGHIINNLLRVD
ncbi:5'-AMP-activated protein kinase subunit beta-2 [Zostera marina]|uniref:5'-AMP-activated protein kinase subunit beta-2 n=1 Tax=Zostera marina TaxID=29655 RepID=A0A0K9P4Q8_ZOSMR|nr:5'-AMP-activated protein kinase subunit beta-2 [Zostera marina]